MADTQQFTALYQFLTKGEEKVLEAYKNINKGMKQSAQIMAFLQGKQKAGYKLSAREIVLLKKHTAEYKRLSKAMGQAGTQGKHLGKSMFQIAKGLVVWAIGWKLAYGALRMFTQGIRDAIKFMSDMQKGMAEIRVVSKGTKAEFSALQTKLVGLGKQFGFTATEMIKGAKIWAQQGKTMAEVAKLTETALYGVNITGQSVETVIENMTAAMKVYNINADESILIIDKWVGVAKKHAVTTGDLADGLKRVGPIAKEMGVSLDELNGYLTAMVAVTRRSGTEVGTVLRTVFARMTKMAKDVIQQIGRIPMFLDDMGNATMRVTGRHRDLSSVLDELSVKWKTYSQVERERIAVQTAGVRRSAEFLALMQNYDEALKARIDSLEAEGTAYEANAILMDTYAKKVEKLKATWQEFLDAVAQAGVIDIMEGIVTAFMHAVEAMTSFSGLVPSYKTVEATMAKALAWNEKIAFGSYQRAKSVAELSKQYIRFYEIVERTGKGQDKLFTIQEALAKVNPDIVKGIKSQEELYGKLKGTMDSLIDETIKEYLTFQKMAITLKFKPELIQLELAKEKAKELVALGEKPLTWLEKLEGDERSLHSKATKNLLENRKELEVIEKRIAKLTKEETTERATLNDRANQLRETIEATAKGLKENVDYVNKFKEALKDIRSANKQNLTLLKASGMEQKDIIDVTIAGLEKLKTKWQESGEEVGNVKNQVAALDRQIEQLKTDKIAIDLKEATKRAEEFGGAMESALFGIAKGTEDLSGVLEKLGDIALKQAISQFGEQTGVFGQIGRMLAGVPGVNKTGQDIGNTASTIMESRAARTGTAIGVAASATMSKMMTSLTGAGIAAGVTAGAGGGINLGRISIPTGGARPPAGDMYAGLSQAEIYALEHPGITVSAAERILGRGQTLGRIGQVAGGALGAYSAYQGAGGGAAGAISGIGSLLMMNPATAPIGLLMMLGGGLFGGKKTQTQSTWNRQQAAEMQKKPFGADYVPPELYPMPECVDDKTEILTDSGWKHFKDLTYRDKVLSLCLDTASKKADYYPIKKIIAEDYSGIMKYYNGYNLDFMVTPNHRFLIYEKENNDGGKRLVLCPLNEIETYKSNRTIIKRNFKWFSKKRFNIISFKYRAGSEFVKKEHLTGNPKQYEFNTDDWLEFLGWFVSEGNLNLYKGDYKISISQKKEPYVSEIRQLLTRMGIKFYEYKMKEGCFQFSFCNKLIYHHLKEETGGKSIVRRVPHYVKELSKRPIAIFLKSFNKGDGDGKGIQYCTFSKLLADDLQELILKTGKYASIKTQGKAFWIYAHTRKCHWRTIIKTDKIQDVQYNGKVYCVEVEPHQTIYIRRNGKCMWSGNSYYFGGRARGAGARERAGDTNVNIRIDRIVGTDARAARLFADEVERAITENYSREEARGLRVTYP